MTRLKAFRKYAEQSEAKYFSVDTAVFIEMLDLLALHHDATEFAAGFISDTQCPDGDCPVCRASIAYEKFNVEEVK